MTNSLFLIALLVSFVFVVVNFIYFLRYNKPKTNKTLFGIVEIWTVVVVPAVFLFSSDIGQENDCCTDSAVFSPGHRTSIYCFIVLYTIAFIISAFRKQVFAPFLELLLNSFLILGLVINILLCIHLNAVELGGLLWFFGNIPIIMLILMKLSKHQQLLYAQIEGNEIMIDNSLGRFSMFILKLEPAMKYPALLVLLVPIVILFSLFLMLFGQKPDSVIAAFSDTYKHGFSQLDYLCDNVQCGGHFLCSVGANGHKSIVRPLRYGERNGGKIICYRQLLVSNAFEDLIQEKFPSMHKFIRRHYNKVGDIVHRYYNIFTNKVFSDIIYILMKPLEWLFLLILYSCDKRPENRIAKQYLNKTDRQIIDKR